MNWCTYHTLRITILSGHREIETEEFAIADVNVTGLLTSQGIDTSVECLIGLHLHGDPRVFAVDRHYIHNNRRL